MTTSDASPDLKSSQNSLKREIERRLVYFFRLSKAASDSGSFSLELSDATGRVLDATWIRRLADAASGEVNG